MLEHFRASETFQRYHGTGPNLPKKLPSIKFYYALYTDALSVIYTECLIRLLTLAGLFVLGC